MRVHINTPHYEGFQIDGDWEKKWGFQNNHQSCSLIFFQFLKTSEKPKKYRYISLYLFYFFFESGFRLQTWRLPEVFKFEASNYCPLKNFDRGSLFEVVPVSSLGFRVQSFVVEPLTFCYLKTFWFSCSFSPLFFVYV